MKRHLAATLSLVSLAILQLACSAMVHADEIMLAGGDEVFIEDAAEAAAGKPNKLWRWNAEEAADVPQAARRDFHHMDARPSLCAAGPIPVILRAFWQHKNARLTNVNVMLLPDNPMVPAKKP